MAAKKTAPKGDLTFPHVPPRQRKEDAPKTGRALRLERFNEREVRSKYDRVAIQTSPRGDDMTQQQFKDDCDVNVLYKRYLQGDMSVVNSRAAFSGDFSQSVDLHQARIMLEEAQDEFERLPSAVRQAADGLPEQLLAMLETEEGCKELQAAGLDLRLPDDDALLHLPEETKVVVQKLSELQTAILEAPEGQAGADSKGGSDAGGQ